MSVRSAILAAALVFLATGGCRDALDGDACLAVCQRQITCDLIGEIDRASCEQACLDGGECDPFAADRCARCMVDTDCDDLEKRCAEACVDPCDPGTGGTGGGSGGSGGDGGGGGGGEPLA